MGGFLPEQESSCHHPGSRSRIPVPTWRAAVGGGGGEELGTEHRLRDGSEERWRPAGAHGLGESLRLYTACRTRFPPACQHLRPHTLFCVQLPLPSGFSFWSSVDMSLLGLSPRPALP